MERPGPRLADTHQRTGRVEREAPTDPQEAYACLVTACHLELGALTYLLLNTNQPGKTSLELAREIYPTANKKSLRAATGTIDGYLNDVFIDVALVAKESFLDTATGETNSSYSVTPFGKTLQGAGYYLIAELTALNNRHNTEIALPQVLGKVAKGQHRKGGEKSKLPATHRTPYFRAQIITMLQGLPEGQTLTTAKIAKQVNIGGTAIVHHLKELLNAGLVIYDSASNEKKGQVGYILVAGHTLPKNIHELKSRHISSDVLNLIYQYMSNIINTNTLAVFDAHTLAEQLYSAHVQNRSSEGKNPISKASFKQIMSEFLSKLKAEGIFETVSFTHSHKSDAQLTPLGRDVAAILTRLRQACDDPMLLREMDRDFQATFSTFLKANAPVLLQRQAEHGKTYGLTDKHIKDIIHLLMTVPTGMRTRDIFSQMQIEASGIILKELRENGILIQEWAPSQAWRNKVKERGKASIYRLSPRATEILNMNPDIAYEHLKALMEAA